MAFLTRMVCEVSQRWSAKPTMFLCWIKQIWPWTLNSKQRASISWYYATEKVFRNVVRQFPTFLSKQNCWLPLQRTWVTWGLRNGRWFRGSGYKGGKLLQRGKEEMKMETACFYFGPFCFRSKAAAILSCTAIPTFGFLFFLYMTESKWVACCGQSKNCKRLFWYLNNWCRVGWQGRNNLQ